MEIGKEHSDRNDPIDDDSGNWLGIETTTLNIVGYVAVVAMVAISIVLAVHFLVCLNVLRIINYLL